MTGEFNPGRQGTCTWTSKPPWLSATAVVREFSYPLPSRGPLLSKQATPEVSADTHTPEPPERVAEVCADEGLRTKGRLLGLGVDSYSGAGCPSPLPG